MAQRKSGSRPSCRYVHDAAFVTKGSFAAFHARLIALLCGPSLLSFVRRAEYWLVGMRPIVRL